VGSSPPPPLPTQADVLYRSDGSVRAAVPIRPNEEDSWRLTLVAGRRRVYGFYASDLLAAGILACSSFRAVVKEDRDVVGLDIEVEDGQLLVFCCVSRRALRRLRCLYFST